ncbi:restriction endonuclease subunit S [Persicobacter psychrovividus]|uniref:Type I restriction modification DNA specificity domain-containing protein n=1 Tax=Persicobacter psychrovividus TaxID=387638 RepID=A0ABM7VIE1_9BACT|nr:hypothetical protein PEPS_30260 [Persicobacter psychrovividus]
MTKNINVPKIRFQEFEGEWDNEPLSNYITSLDSGVSVNSEDTPITNSEQIGILKTSAISNGRFYHNQNKTIIPIERNRAKLNPKQDSIIISRMNTPELVGEIGYIDKDYLNLFIPDRLWQTTTNEKVNVQCLSQSLITPKSKFKIRSLATGTSGSMKNISKPSFLSLKVSLPTLPEQQKIATFLSSVDQKIEQLQQKHRLLEQYKKGVMHKLFPAQGEKHPQVRFKDDDGKDFADWEVKKFTQAFERVTRKNKENNKNVMTISAQQGLINQEEYFNKSVSAKDVSGYYLLHKGDFAYNKSYSAGYPMGAIKKLNRYDKGVVSTLYICFKAKENSNADFFEQYFEAGKLNKEIHKIAQEGARNHGLLNVSVVEFFNDIQILIPTFPEQRKIATFLTSIDEKITSVGSQLDQAQAFKKGLLQGMFV